LLTTLVDADEAHGRAVFAAIDSAAAIFIFRADVGTTSILATFACGGAVGIRDTAFAVATGVGFGLAALFGRGLFFGRRRLHGGRFFSRHRLGLRLRTGTSLVAAAPPLHTMPAQTLVIGAALDVGFAFVALARAKVGLGTVGRLSAGLVFGLLRTTAQTNPQQQKKHPRQQRKPSGLHHKAPLMCVRLWLSFTKREALPDYRRAPPHPQGRS